ncbi:hypothetical protein L211DRAFT_873079 [Terfezia boudieri ATCC MYA-4762]|uniref:Uncharacterized protein n=1 Tax=Terfezia boudieri ATCC MYA-4762 TaxID=1051890 RepID=A0A3N4MBA1_9PEZI|nr:hypothetical protein L211DRAFT_873079 [Terfezia boudieri ATCC MYA-4762]
MILVHWSWVQFLACYFFPFCFVFGALIFLGFVAISGLYGLSHLLIHQLSNTPL